MGARHVEKIAANVNTRLVAIIDSNPQVATTIANNHQVPLFATLDDCDIAYEAAVVVVPTNKHFTIVQQLLRRGIHTLVEKPICVEVSDAKALIDCAQAHNAILHVGHSQRYHPLYQYLMQHSQQPQFISCERLSPFKARGCEVNVVHDLMIHDIDLCHTLLQKHKPAAIINIQATGVAVLTDTIDIVNARIQYASGASVNLSASRLTPRAVRAIRIFAHNTYFSADFGKRSAEHYIVDGNKKIIHDTFSAAPSDELQQQANMFIDAIRHSKPADISGEDGLTALEIANKISDAARLSFQTYSRFYGQ